MSTRGLLIIQFRGAPQVAQYVRSDAYETGFGAEVVRFLREVDIKQLKRNMASVVLLSPELVNSMLAMKALQLAAERKEQLVYEIMTPSDALRREHPSLGYSASTVLSQLRRKTMPDEFLLRDDRDFAGQSLYCEYVYYIDLDNGLFEVYTAGSREPAPQPGERFAHLTGYKCFDGTVIPPPHLTFSRTIKSIRRNLRATPMEQSAINARIVWAMRKANGGYNDENDA